MGQELREGRAVGRSPYERRVLISAPGKVYRFNALQCYDKLFHCIYSESYHI